MRNNKFRSKKKNKKDYFIHQNITYENCKFIFKIQKSKNTFFIEGGYKEKKRGYYIIPCFRDILLLRNTLHIYKKNLKQMLSSLNFEYVLLLKCTINTTHLVSSPSHRIYRMYHSTS